MVRRVGLSSLGIMRRLKIFSRIRGTDNIRWGRTFRKASVMICGDGVRVRKVMWQPVIKGHRNSKRQPLAWAMGRKETMRSPATRSKVSEAYCTLDQMLRWGSNTPFEKPEVPEV